MKTMCVMKRYLSGWRSRYAK